jgi:hypothetical protein
VEIVAGIDPVGSQQVSDGVGRRDLLGVVEVHGDGEVFCGEPSLEAADRCRIGPVRLKPEKSRPEGRLVLTAGTPGRA